MHKQRVIVKFLGLTLAAASLAASAAYPVKPVKIIVPYQPGQGTDIATRYFADHLSQTLGQPFIVENRGGAGGNIGTQAAARAEPDGYTLIMGTNATHSLNQFLYSSPGYDAVKDFDPIILLGTFPMVLVTPEGSKLKTVGDILKNAGADKRDTDIGMPSTTARLVYELLKEKTKAPLFGVPYKGSSMATSNLIGGEIAVSIDTITASRAMIESKRLAPIAVTSLKQTELLPGVPTVASQGVKDFEVIAWNALYAPKGTPKEAIDTINKTLQTFLNRPDTRKRMLEMGYEPGGGAPGDLKKFTESEQKKWGPVIQRAGIKFD
ncbi:Bug family tripartite tricarboxylate transporter substrate binding protein [Allopusillimonas ginsengisoli]|uniref:Bug family tripartite tricarboxylate transporter substrate binding protein n=1 Tax=Allopusillimonas ginsengisoli TaxID=453575 RepID=UPI0010C171BF|nr:tripartite tricarboxylate transporter substrate binding protein [Allopusillimonas ginsengisoli]